MSRKVLSKPEILYRKKHWLLRRLYGFHGHMFYIVSVQNRDEVETWFTPKELFGLTVDEDAPLEVERKIRYANIAQ